MSSIFQQNSWRYEQATKIFSSTPLKLWTEPLTIFIVPDILPLLISNTEELVEESTIVVIQVIHILHIFFRQLKIKHIKVLTKSIKMNGLWNSKDFSLNQPTNDDLSICLIVLLTNHSNLWFSERNHLGRVRTNRSAELTVSSDSDSLRQAIGNNAGILIRDIKLDLCEMRQQRNGILDW